jgi:hypothetical protein
MDSALVCPDLVVVNSSKHVAIETNQTNQSTIHENMHHFDSTYTSTLSLPFLGVITMKILDKIQVSRMMTCSVFRDTLAQEGGFVETTFAKTRYYVSQHVKSTTRGAGDG